MSERIVITGAGGFIGEHLAGSLAMNTVPHGAMYHTLPELPRDSRRATFVGDLLDKQFVREAFTGYDVVVHLAGRTGRGQLEDPAEFVRKNVETTAVVYSAARDAGVKRVILASSYEVYGFPQHLPLDEGHQLVPASPYGVTMLAREQLARMLGQAYSIRTVILRFFSVFGTPVSERNRKGAISTFVKKLARDEELTLTGSTDSMRDYIYVADVVRCLTQCISEPALGDTTLNLGTGVGTSLANILDGLRDYFPGLRCSNGVTANAPQDCNIIASTEKIRSELGFSCQFHLASALRDMLAPGVTK